MYPSIGNYCYLTIFAENLCERVSCIFVYRKNKGIIKGERNLLSK